MAAFSRAEANSVLAISVVTIEVYSHVLRRADDQALQISGGILSVALGVS